MDGSLVTQQPGRSQERLRVEPPKERGHADAAPISFDESTPQRLVNFVLGPHTPRLREFKAAHPEVRMTTGHMWLDSFEEIR